MTNDLIQTTGHAKAPAIQTRADADLLSKYRSKITLGSDGISWLITEGDEPRGADRVMLEARRTELGAFAPADSKAIGAMIARMFLRYPTTTKGTPEMVAAYVLDLKRFPLWAITKGIARIIHGLSSKPHYAPTSLEVQAAVRAVLEPVQTEFAMIGNVLNARLVSRPSLTPEERAAAVADWRRHGLSGPPQEDAAHG